MFNYHHIHPLTNNLPLKNKNHLISYGYSFLNFETFLKPFKIN
jgi:hypothetical protein